MQDFKCGIGNRTDKASDMERGDYLIIIKFKKQTVKSALRVSYREIERVLAKKICLNIVRKYICIISHT